MYITIEFQDLTPHSSLLTPHSPFPLEEMEEWLQQVVESHSRKLGSVHYIFCSDRRILEINRQFLQHDYYTDIITFDYSDSHRVSGDIFLSLDTVSSNALLLQRPEMEEFWRVVAHGVLHLCGINDKGPGEREIMENCENKALQILRETPRFSEKMHILG